MVNQHIARIFFDLAGYLEMDNIPFKPVAYRKAAIIIDNLATDLKDLYLKGGKKALQQINGIGVNLANKIEEYLQSGTIHAFEVYKKHIPVDMENLMKIEGLGPKRIKELYQKLGVKNIADLEKVLENHQVSTLFGFGDKTEANIVMGLSLLKANRKRFPLHILMPKINKIIAVLKKVPGVKKISVAGSVRRKKTTVGDVDILAVSTSPKKIMSAFTSLPSVIKVWGKGTTKASVAMKEGFDVDLRVVSNSSYGAALQYFTGSKEHNIKLRKIAQDKGLKLNEYGVFRNNVKIAGDTEEGVYKILGMQWIPPEQRI